MAKKNINSELQFEIINLFDMPKSDTTKYECINKLLDQDLDLHTLTKIIKNIVFLIANNNKYMNDTLSLITRSNFDILYERMKNENKKLDNKIIKLETENKKLNDKIIELNSKLSEYTLTSNSHVADYISLEENFDKKLKQLSIEITNKFMNKYNDVKSNLITKIENIETAVKQLSIEINDKYSNKLNEVKSNFSTKIDQYSTEINSRIDEMYNIYHIFENSNMIKVPIENQDIYCKYDELSLKLNDNLKLFEDINDKFEICTNIYVLMENLRMNYQILSNNYDELSTKFSENLYKSSKCKNKITF